MNHLKPVGGLDRVKVANIQGNNHPTYDGVVARAHRDANDRGFVWVGTEVELKQAPHVSNNMQAIVWAKCKFVSLLEPGDFSFEGIADADPDNCNARTKSALVRMAATRAKSVALRDALNIDEALADEISEQGPAPQQNFGGQQQNQQQGGGYQQNNQSQGGGGMPAWKYTIPGKKYPQGTRIDDPNVALDDIIYWHSNGLQQKNQQTGAYDMPDPERVALFAAEIAKRQGGHVGPAQNQQQGGYQQNPPQQQQGYQQQGYQQQGGYQQNPPQPQAQQPQQGGWKPTSQHIANLVKQGNTVGVNYQGLKDRCMAEFNKADPTQLEEHQYITLMVGLGGNP
jgi:hypothetical protein